jgi:hypothetical protein
MVEHSLHNPKVQGLCPTIDTGRVYDVKKFRYCLASCSSTVVVKLPLKPKVQGLSLATGIGRVHGRNEFMYCMANEGSIVAVPTPHHSPGERK